MYRRETSQAVVNVADNSKGPALSPMDRASNSTQVVRGRMVKRIATTLQEETAAPPMAPRKLGVRIGSARQAGGGGNDHGLTRRAVAVGLLLVGFVAAFTPYNDYVLQNSPFIGNHFPIGIVSLMAILILLVNPALRLMSRNRSVAAGRGAFSRGELIVIMTMMLVAAAVPSSGLMRYLEPMMVSPYWIVRDFPWLKSILNLMPAWLVPTTDGSSATVTNYWLGIDPVSGGHVPILGFLLPALLWGVLVAAILGGAFFLSAIFRKQWVHHERLTFPLATIPLELMAPPEEGRLYNALWRNPILWAGAALPILVYLLAGLHAQFPAVPQIELRYDVRSAFTDRPWDALPTHITQAQLWFAAVGICFFIPSEIAFSMWFFLVANGFLRVILARSSFDPGAQENTRAMGIYVAYFAGLLWLARGHLRHVLAAAWKKSPRADDEPLSYRTMVLGWGICMLVAWGWLLAVGMSPVMAAVLLAVGTMLVTLMARIVTETGLFFVGPIWWPNELFSTLLGAKLVSMKSFFWTQVTSRIFFADLRETLMPFAANSMRMGQELKGDERPRWIRWLLLSLLVSLLISGGMHHYLSYTRGRTAILDNWASNEIPKGALQETYQFANSPADGSMTSSWGHFVFGGLMATGLMVGRVLWAGWPFHPIGLVLMSSGPMKAMWFSIFVGWGAKRLLLRYGGAGAFRRARPFFVGLIVGEILSAGAWMFVGLLTNGAVRYTLLPG